MVVWEMVGACLICLIALPLARRSRTPMSGCSISRASTAVAAAACLACTVFAHAFHIHLLRYLSAYTANLAINFEPVYGIIAAAVLFGEHRQLHPGFSSEPARSCWRTFSTR